MANLNRILSKSGWTGRELGILELTNMAVLFKSAQSGEPGTPVVSLDRFRAMLQELTDPKQLKVYNGYISIHEWLSIKYNMAYAQSQVAVSAIQNLTNYITTAFMAEGVFAYIETLPAIMTQKQYDEERQARLTAICKNSDATGIDLVLYATDYYLSLLHTSPRKANPLKTLKKKYADQAIEDENIVGTWLQYFSPGYYTLPDGRRSDQMTEEEWRKATTPSNKNDPGVRLNGLIAHARALYDGASLAEADKVLDDYNIEHGLIVKSEWYPTDNLEHPLTKWDIIEDIRGLYADDIPAFQRDFGDLIQTMSKAIKKKYGIDITSMDQIILTGQQLYDLDFYGAQERLESGLWDVIGDEFKANRRAALNGVSIVTPSSLGRNIIDDKGYYAEGNTFSLTAGSTLDAFAPDSELYAQNCDAVENETYRLLTSLYFVYGYNAALDMIAKYYDVPDITAFKMNVANIEEMVRNHNKLLVVLYQRIFKTDYADAALKEKKLNILKDVFGAIDISCVQPIDEHITEARKLLEGFQAFTDENGGQDRFMNLLFLRPENGGADND